MNHVKPIRFRLDPDAASRSTSRSTSARASMVRHEREVRGSRGLTRTQALCHVFRDRLKEAGEINYHRGRLDAEIVGHEIAHAAVGWARRMKINLDTECGSAENERFCYASSTMLRDCHEPLLQAQGVVRKRISSKMRSALHRPPAPRRRRRAPGPRPGPGDDRPGPA